MANHPRRTAITVAVAVTALGVAGCGHTQVNQGIPPTESATATSTVEADSVTDTSELRNLMAISTHVFTGRVESGAGTRALGPIPETQYSVLTATSLKGEVAQSVTVNQQGGTQDGVYISVDGDHPLTVGQWYLFATRYLESEKWYTIVPVDGHTPITEQQARDTSSPPLAAALAAQRANPHNQLTSDDPPSPSLTFPIPQPGDQNPPPPSTPQPR
ncbi:hypothetical protein ACIGKQ_22420 [Gordonia sp. NPDC062954]|uniref:hypothetical protein n=1 Tax=Gordonia sp. NPDC062954 TaxID=3364003 RepID=UPI0037C7FBE1